MSVELVLRVAELLRQRDMYLTEAQAAVAKVQSGAHDPMDAADIDRAILSLHRAKVRIQDIRATVERETP